MPPGGQENMPAVAPPPPPLVKPAAAAAPFRFRAPRALIDWRTLRALDVGAVVRDTDLDALEGVLEAVAGGDLEAEDPRALPWADLAKLFRVAQLTVDYLLHVQDRLATDAGAAQDQLGRLQQREQALALKVKELREELAGSRKEARHLKRALRTVEGLARQPPAEARVVERQVPDPAAAARAERAEAEAARQAAERETLQRDNSKLAKALAAAAAGSAAAVEAARHEERAAAAARLQAAVEEERKRQSKPAKLSVLVSADDASPGLPAKLAAAQRQEREAERRAEAAEAALGRAAKAAADAVPAAEVRRLRAALEAAQAEADMLRSRLGARERQLSPVRAGTPVGSQPRSGGGLAAELEDVDEARVQQLEAQVASLQRELAAVQDARAQLATRCAQLEQQLREARAQQRGSVGPAAAAEAEVWEGELARLRGEKAALKEEVRRLRQEAARNEAEIEHLTQRLQQLASSGGRGTASQRSSPTKATAAAAAAQPAQQAPEGASREGIGSPIEDDACGTAGAASAAPPASQRPSSRPASPLGRRAGSAGAGRATPPSPAAPLPHHMAAAPSEADQRQFRAEMRHTLASAARPGVVSRFPHSLGAFLALRGDLQGELEAELGAELASFGLDPAAEGLTEEQYAAAMAALERRREEARRCMSPADQRRMDYMRSTVEWHLQRMAEQASGQRDASPVKRPALVQAPNLRPIRTMSGGAEEGASPRRRGLVEQVLDQVGDEEAIYSPLARGASVLSERFLEAAGAGTPRAGGGAPAASDGRATPRSPWSATHSRVGAADLYTLHTSPLAASAASSPSHQPRQVARAVQFESNFDDGGGGGWSLSAGGTEQAVAAQRVGRRPSFTGGPVGPASPGRRRVPHAGAEEIQPAAAEAGWVRDSRDQDTGEAAAVRPAPRRMPRQQCA